MKQNINMNDFLHLVASLLVDWRAAVEVRTNEVNINMNDFLHLVDSLLVDWRAAVEVRTNEVKHQHE